MTDSAALLADEVLLSKALRQWVLSPPFALRFLLATDAEALTQVLGIAYRTISAHVLKKTGLARASGATGAVTLIQRFGSALNLNIHLHMLVLDGAYLVGTEPPVFRRMAPPGEAELQALVERLAERVGRALERRGVLARDAESTYLELGPAAGGPIDDLLGHSITYRVAVGPRAGQKVFSRPWAGYRPSAAAQFGTTTIVVLGGSGESLGAPPTNSLIKNRCPSADTSYGMCESSPIVVQ
jgi:Putative transposase